jgi:hypothetical protein
VSIVTPCFCLPNVQVELRAPSEKEASRQLQAVVGRQLILFIVLLFNAYPIKPVLLKLIKIFFFVFFNFRYSIDWF